MTYVLPQVQVFQEFTPTPVAPANPLNAHIGAGHAQLVRYAQASEQELGFLAIYDSVENHNYAWPNLDAGGLIDPTYTKLWIKNALLQYFSTSIGGGDDVTVLASNQIHGGAINFATHGSYLRSGVFFDRDVRAGDIVKIRGLNGSTPVTVWSSVQSVQGDAVGPVVGAATSDSSNAANQGASASCFQTAGPTNSVVATPNGTAYNGLASGFITETYDVLVTTGSVNGDLTTAVVRVISGSGTDDVAAVSPSAEDTFFAVGTRGLTLSFADSSHAGSISAIDNDLSAIDLLVGQRWRVTVKQAFTAPAPTSGGTYNGGANTTYIVSVIRGGLYATSPLISVSTTNGVDISGPTAVTAANTAVPIGSQGTTIQFNQTGLRTGDRYYVPVTAATTGPMKILVLNNNIPSTIAVDSEIDLTLYILNPNLAVPEDRTSAPPLLNWTQSQQHITVNAGITAFDPTWTNNGAQVALPVVGDAVPNYGQVFVEYRAWLPDLSESVNFINDVGQLDAQISGALDPDNPLKWGVYSALLNSNGANVGYTGVSDPTNLDDWSDLLGLLVGRADVYGLVPVSNHNAGVQALYQAHINDESAATMNAWRVAWFALVDVPEIPLVSAGSTVPNHLAATTSDGQVALCTITNDPLTGGNTIVTCASGNAKFITNGVQAGDFIRALYTGDGFGGFTYSEFEVASVVSEDELNLVAGPAVPINVAAKTEVWRTLNASSEASEIAKQAGSFASFRVRAVWPDQIGMSGKIVSGEFAACALAGLTSGILPHRSLTNLQIAGFDDVTRTIPKFNRSQLDTMAGSGVTIITKDPVSGSIYVRHGLTCGDQTQLNQREEMVIRNVDSISFRFAEAFAPFIGQYNITPDTLTTIRTEFTNVKSALQRVVSPSLGGQLIDATLTSLAQDPVLADHVNMNVTLTIPFALNNLVITLVI